MTAFHCLEQSGVCSPNLVEHFRHTVRCALNPGKCSSNRIVSERAISFQTSDGEIKFSEVLKHFVEAVPEKIPCCQVFDTVEMLASTG